MRRRQRRELDRRIGGGAKAGKVAVLLPDSKSSVRWETLDRPLLKAAFDKAGVESEIQNAEGDKSAQQQQAEQAITNGAKVLLLVEPRLGLGRGHRGERQVAGRQGHRLRPPDAQRRLRLLRLVRQRAGRQAPGRGHRQLPRGRDQARRRRAQRLADGQQRDAVQEGLRLGHQPEVQVRRVDRGRRSVRARLGQPEGADDLRADAAEGRQQGRRRRSPPTTGSATPRSRRSRRASSSRSRSPARTRRCRASRTSSTATSA